MNYIIGFTRYIFRIFQNGIFFWIGFGLCMGDNGMGISETRSPIDVIICDFFTGITLNNPITKLWECGGAWVVQNGQVLSFHFDFDFAQTSIAQVPLLHREPIAIVSQTSLGSGEFMK